MHYQVLTQWAKAEAASRTAIHDELSSQRKLSDGFESIAPLRFTVDVKTACKAFNLILEVGKVTADIYVLAEFNWEGERARLVG
jgi:mannose/fructose/N-acetylgalactosamine-specific phosphotransferase system component IIB